MRIKEIGCGLDSTGLWYSLVAWSCEHGNEHSDSINGIYLVSLVWHGIFTFFYVTSGKALLLLVNVNNFSLRHSNKR